MAGFRIEGVVTITVDESLPCLVTIWHGYATSRQFREITERTLELIVTHGLTKGLSDARNMKMIAASDQQWLTTILPRFTEAGYRASALIIPEDYFARLSVDMLIQKIGPGEIITKYFDSVEDARAWLAEIE